MDIGRASAPHRAPRTGDAERVEAARSLLRDHKPADPMEAASTARILSELSRLDRPFDRLASHVHVTASAVVVGPRGTVLHLHRRLRRWLQPGGHVDPGETPESAALREAEEETGLPVAHPPGGPLLIHVDVHPAAQGHIHLDLRYLLLAADEDPSPPAGESQEVGWFQWQDAEEMADRSLAGALAAARRAWKPEPAHDAR